MTMAMTFEEKRECFAYDRNRALTWYGNVLIAEGLDVESDAFTKKMLAYAGVMQDRFLAQVALAEKEAAGVSH